VDAPVAPLLHDCCPIGHDDELVFVDGVLGAGVAEGAELVAVLAAPLELEREALLLETADDWPTALTRWIAAAAVAAPGRESRVAPAFGATDAGGT
jgi:hypothetical protein